jgi:hypothetical protein
MASTLFFTIEIVMAVGEFGRYRERLRLGQSGDLIPEGAIFFAHIQTGPGNQPASCTMGPGSFSGVKWPGRSADHPPSCSAEVQNE